jgi:hypothetical protein
VPEISFTLYSNATEAAAYALAMRVRDLLLGSFAGGEPAYDSIGRFYYLGGPTNYRLYVEGGGHFRLTSDLTPQRVLDAALVVLGYNWGHLLAG